MLSFDVGERVLFMAFFYKSYNLQINYAQYTNASNNMIWASTRENLSSGVANNKGAGQSAHSSRLISAFVIRFLESTTFKLDTSKIYFF